MKITPFSIWLFTFIVTIGILPFFPQYLLLMITILIVHGLIVTWGVFDFRIAFFGAITWRLTDTASIMLTFDDGPDPALTPDILTLLDKYAMQAVFFVVADKARHYPDVLKRMVSSGHTIGCHDLYHRPTDNFRLAPKLLEEINQAKTIIANTAGIEVCYYRPPVGLLNPHVLPVLRALNLRCIGWSRRSGEMGNRRVNRIKALPALVRGGEILLMHDILPVPALKEIVLDSVEKVLIEVRRQKLKTTTITN